MTPSISAPPAQSRNEPITATHPSVGRRHPGPARPKKSLGQHFLVDRRYLGRIVEAADLSAADLVVEVGPGRGDLTKPMAERAGRLVAVELDAQLAAQLQEKNSDRPHVTVVEADARQVGIDSLVAPDEPYKVVANLPYYAASPIIRRFLEADHKPVLMVVTVQREVANEMAAAPGKMRLLSVATQLYGSPRIVSTVPPNAFRPAPKVTSAIVRIDVYDNPAVRFDSEERFFELVRAGFSAPRKQVHNCLSRGLNLSPEATQLMLSQAAIEPSRRAQTVSLAEWGELYAAYRVERPGD